MMPCDDCTSVAIVQFFEPNGELHSTKCNDHALKMFQGWCCQMGCDNCKLDPLLRLKGVTISKDNADA